MDSKREETFVFMPEPAPGSPPPPRRSKPTPKRSAWPFVLIGIPLGIVLTILGQRMLDSKPARHKFDPAAVPQTALPTPLPTPSPPPSAGPTPDPMPTPVPGEPNPLDGLNFIPAIFGGSVPGGVPGPTPDFPKPGGLAGKVPFLPGPGPNGGIPPVQPNVEGVTDGNVPLTTMLLSTTDDDTEAAQGRIAAIARKFGGSATSFIELAEKREGDRPAVLLVVPIDKKTAVAAALKAAGASTDEDWKGTLQERQVLLEERLVLGLHDLQRTRDTLLAKFYEDAGPVKDIDDRIAVAQKQLRAVRIGKAEGRAVIRVYVGPNA
jgi:hypothetical protein